MKRKELTIYFDMDGVLADFDKACKSLKHLSDMPWLDVKGFFRNLEAIGTPNDTIALLQEMGYPVKILTSVDLRGRNGQERGQGKIEWLQEYVPSIDEKDVILVPIGEPKTNYIKTEIAKSVLVDDYKVNLENWKNRGGIAVKFGNKWKSTRNYLQIVKDIFHIIPVVESLENKLKIA